MRTKSAEYKLLTGLFFKLLPFQVLLVLVCAVNGIIDSLFGSNFIGVTAMSAVGLFGPFTHLLYALFMIFVSGSQILYGRYLVRERERINGLFTVDILVSLAVAVLISLAMVIAGFTGLTRFVISEEPNLTMFNHYIYGQAFGISAFIVGQQLFSFLSLENKTKWTMAASIINLIAKIVFDCLFIVIFPLGTFGLGLSTSAANFVFLFFLALYYIMGKSEWHFSLKAVKWKDALTIVKLGHAGATSRVAEMIRCFIINYLILKYVNADGLSSFAASNSLLALVWAVPFGMVAVGRMLFSVSVGEQDRKSLVDSLHIIYTKGILLMLGLVALIIIFAKPLTMLFYRDPSQDVFSMTVMGFRLLPLCMPLAVVSLTFAALTQTLERRAISFVLPIVDGAVGVVSCSIFLIPLLQMNGLYIANILNGAICFILIAVFAWVETKQFPNTLEKLMAIPPRIGVSEDNRIDISIQSMDEVVNVSRQVIAFCKEKGIPDRIAFFAGLCMEEMAGNVVTHGFSKDSKQHSIDIRVINTEQGLILRLRDNCMAFNPTERRKTMQNYENWKNIGIRLVYKIAKNVDYQNLLGMNVLTIYF